MQVPFSAAFLPAHWKQNGGAGRASPHMFFVSMERKISPSSDF